MGLTPLLTSLVTIGLNHCTCLNGANGYRNARVFYPRPLCSVVKGPPELPGIFVQTVKLHGLAEIAGLEIGDQITEVNGQGFLNVEFSEVSSLFVRNLSWLFFFFYRRMWFWLTFKVLLVWYEVVDYS